MKYSDLETLLKGVLPDATYHFSAPKGVTRYIAWMEATSHSDFGDDRRGLTALGAIVYVYVQDSEDGLLGDVLAALGNPRIAYTDPVPTYDDEMLTFYWTIEVEFV